MLPRGERLERLGFRDIPEQSWIAIDRQEAATALTACLARGQAYDSPIMPLDQAREFAEAFVQRFEEDVRFLTNSGRFLPDRDDLDASWSPISTRTFDTGVLIEADGVVGILWMEDED